MKIKNILLGIFSLLTFSTYAQSEKSNVTETNSAVTEFKIEAENFDVLKNFDWDVVKELFKENDEDQEITLMVAYVNKSERDNSEFRIDNFEFKFTGPTANLDKFTTTIKSSIESFAEINELSKN